MKIDCKGEGEYPQTSIMFIWQPLAHWPCHRPRHYFMMAFFAARWSLQQSQSWPRAAHKRPRFAEYSVVTKFLEHENTLFFFPFEAAGEDNAWLVLKVLLGGPFPQTCNVFTTSFVLRWNVFFHNPLAPLFLIFVQIFVHVCHDIVRLLFRVFLPLYS